VNHALSRIGMRGRPGAAWSPMDGALDAVLTLFLLSCVFDPADQLLGLKVWLFLLAWSLTIARASASANGTTLVPLPLLAYVALFLAIPLFSVLRLVLGDGSIRPEGLNMLKGYLLITLAPMLALNRIDLLPRLGVVLSCLAFAIIGTYIALHVAPEFHDALYVFGAITGIVLVDTRDYAQDVSFLQVYFVTSPLLAISIAWYFHRASAATTPRSCLAASALVSLHVIAMMLAGTRNNILVSIALPAALWMLYARRKMLVAAGSVVIALALALTFSDPLRAFFDPGEVSNSTKLALLGDYGRILADPWTLLFGRGLGAYELWTAKSEYNFISELTYLELIRNFGLPAAVLMVALLLVPVWRAFANRSSMANRAIALGYALYLVMCISNPNLFSSMGILILCVTLVRLYPAMPSTESRRVTR
jgi:hypothetical protein